MSSFRNLRRGESSFTTAPSAARSAVPGPSGNVEYFVWLHASAGPLPDDVIAKAIAEGPIT